MKVVVIAVVSVIVGAVAGYSFAQLGRAPAISTLEAHGPASLELSGAQIDRLAAQLAPAVASRLGKDSQPIAQPASAPVADALEKAAAFGRAVQIVDQMIANRSITNEGLDATEEILRKSGQADRGYEIHGRIAAAMNRGELTAEQAGWLRPGM